MHRFVLTGLLLLVTPAWADELCRVHSWPDGHVVVTCPAQTPTAFADLPFIDVLKSSVLAMDPAKQAAWRVQNGQLVSDPTVPLPPDVAGFKAWLKDTLSLDLKKKVHSLYPGLVHALNQPDWPMVEDYLTDAKTNATLNLTAGQWNALRTAALTTYRLPITLPAAS